MSDDFRFTSPHDDHIDRATYLERCRPNSERTKSINIRKLFDRGDEAFVLYDLEPEDAEPFRNAEFFTGRDGKIESVQVYFGSKIGTVEDTA